ncbi:hypothetical protein [Chromobacterium sinusclupearum]|uniref:hypothetical protein n=1 Tax=Chromobacterium sinusclupearum TaxID=2077146 RepID=UPI0011AF234C|nr:hypothetical protein [Chromobacterium sinusclupearum]
MKRSKPISTFPCNPDELYRAVCFGDINEVADELAVTTEQIHRWRTGQEPVPKAVSLWLKHRNCTTLGAQFGPFKGFRLCDRGDALVCPASGMRINFSEIPLLDEYRRANKLAERQAELIEKLMTDRNFYRDNCHL